MTNKEKLKKIINEDINTQKNYEKVINKINNSNHSNKIWKIIFIPICLIIITTSLFINGTTKKQSTDNFNREYSDTSKYVNININTINNLKLSEYNTYTKYILKNNIDTSSSSIIKIDVPKDIKLVNIAYIYFKNELNNYTEIYKGNNKSRYIYIAYAKNHEPISKYQIDEENTIKSIINKMELRIYKYKKTYLVRFNYNNIFYEIEASNITLEELKNILLSIIN